MKTVPCIFAALCLLAANGYAQNRYETLKEHAAGPLQELRFEVESDDRVTVPDVELDLGTEFLALDALLNAVQRRNPSLESARNSWQAALA